MRAFDFAGRTKIPPGPQVGKPCFGVCAFTQLHVRFTNIGTYRIRNDTD